MSYCILKESIKFELGLSDEEQLKDVLSMKKESLNHSGLAFVGRSNVGKSSLINRLFSQRAARVSKTPGRTRQINVFSFYLYDKEKKDRLGPFDLFDLPGYGHADISKEMKRSWRRLMDIFFSHIGDGVLILNLQDARHLNTKVDQEFTLYLRRLSLKTHLVLNKIDKLKNQKERLRFEDLLKDFLLKEKVFKQVFRVSAEKETGIEGLKLSILNHLLQ